jgi:hypothetical protein
MLMQAVRRCSAKPLGYGILRLGRNGVGEDGEVNMYPMDQQGLHNRVIVNGVRFVRIATASLHFFGNGRDADFEGSGAVVSLSIMLVCAVLASLAVGVLVAYGICVAMFGIFQMHARQVAAGRTAQSVVAPVQTVES